jgi:N-methylhydantoinase B/oxoprolinase/acetone carboxylase alpha subunit
VGDVMALATSNSVGVRRVGEMLREFEEPDLGGVSEFIRQASLSATRARIAELSPGRAEAAMRTDGFSAPVELRCAVTVGDGEIECDFAGTSGLDPKGINVPLVYTKAYAAYAMKCAIAPDIPNNAASLSPFSIAAPEGSIVNAPHPAPVALRHVIGHLIPDVVFGALDQLVPGVVPAEGAGALCNFQLSLRPTGQGGRSAEVLSFNSGGAGARPSLDGLSATAFPSGVMTMPAEAVEHSGPVVVWRKELRGGSGGHGTFRGGLGQVMEVGARPGHEMTISAMLDRVENPARGRRGGGTGAATDISLHDGTPLRGKGRQRVPADARVVMKFPGGGGYGPAGERSRAAVLRDVAMGYVDPEDAVREYGADPAEVDAAVTAAARGQLP